MNIFQRTDLPIPSKNHKKELQNKILEISAPELYTHMSEEERKRNLNEMWGRGDGNVAAGGKNKSVYALDTKKVFKILNEISPSMCLAKWYSVSIHIPTGKTHSCYHPPSHKIPLAELERSSDALHNTAYKKEQRTKMLNGERPSECSFCWNIEDSGEMLSDRAYRSMDVYGPDILKELANDLDTGNPTPRYVEVNFNQSCNFKCAYCSPHLSTEWMDEVEKLGPIKLLNGRKHNDITWMTAADMVPDNSPDNPYIKAFWDWFPVIYPTLKTFRMTGGEPLMDKNTFKIFDYVLDHPKGKDLHLSITSNCCPPKNQWAKFLDKLNKLEEQDAIDHFMLFCSLDSWGPQAEYIRNGLDFNKMYNNVTEYLRCGKKHSITFIVTFNALSIPGWLEYLKNILELRKTFNTTRQLVWFDVPMLLDPDWLCLKLLPQEDLLVLKESIEYMNANKETNANFFKGFKDYEIDKVQRLYDWAIRPWDEAQLTAARANFHLFHTQHDERRGTNFKETFPTMNHLIAMSKEAHYKYIK